MYSRHRRRRHARRYLKQRRLQQHVSKKKRTHCELELKLTRRRAQKSRLLQRSFEVENWGNFLHRILEEDSEDSTSIKVFLLVWGFGGKKQRLAAATDGRGWWRKRCQGLGRILEKRRVKNRVFHVEERIYNLQISLSELVLLSRIPLFMLSGTIQAQRNSLYTKARSAGQFLLSAIPSRVGNALSAPLLTQRDIRSCYFKNPNGHTLKQCLRKLQTKFEDDPTINQSEIVVLLKYVWVKFEIS